MTIADTAYNMIGTENEPIKCRYLVQLCLYKDHLLNFFRGQNIYMHIQIYLYLLKRANYIVFLVVVKDQLILEMPSKSKHQMIMKTYLKLS